MCDIKLGICSIVKDTPDYMMKEWIDHHFNIGVSKICIYVDFGSKEIYQDERVEYVYLTKDLRNKLCEYGRKYSAESVGTDVQLGVYNIFLDENKDKLDWIAFIDDDEFLELDIDELKNYDSETCVMLPWKMMFTKDVSCTNTLDNYIEFPPFEEYVNSIENKKPIVNTKHLWKVRNIHSADFCGVFMGDFDDINQDYRYDKMCSSKPINAINLFMNAKNYIRHYKVRTFEEWVESIVDRKYLIYNTYKNLSWDRTIYSYFYLNPFYNGKLFSDSKFVNHMLDLIHRQDVKESPYNIFSDIKSYDEIEGEYQIIYNMNNNKIISEQEYEKLFENAEDKKFIIVDYVDAFSNFDFSNKKVVLLDKNTVLLNMRKVNKLGQENIEEKECFKKTIELMFNKITGNITFYE